MSCDRDRSKWWGYLGRWYRNHLSRNVQNALKKGLENYVQSKVEDALKGGSGPKYSGRGSRRGTSRGTRDKTPGRSKKTTAGASQGGRLTQVSLSRARSADLPEIIFGQVKQAAQIRENDWTHAERDDLAWKSRMLRRVLRTKGKAPLDIDPAHGHSDLPKISSQAGFAAVYDWMKEAEVDVSSPLDPVYKTIWQEDNDYSERERIELHRLVEEIDVQYQRGYLKKNPRKTLLKNLKEHADPQTIRALMADEVQFTIFHPAKAKAREWQDILVYVHRASAAAAVHRDASKFKDDMRVPVEVRLRIALA